MNQRTRIKFCGITRMSDAAAAVALGVDALGFVFHAPSPRNVAPETVRDILHSLPAFVSAVGLFVDAPLDVVRETVDRVGLSLVQFHGEETPEYCASFGRPYVKVVRMRDAAAVATAERQFPGASGLLLDTWHPQLAGGTGQVFDWDLVPRGASKALILAGGLTVANVGEAIRRTSPFAVDVSGGIEESKGLKDPVKMRRFVAEVNTIDREQ